MNVFPTNIDDGVQLALTRVERASERLDLAYTVTNGAGVTIYLANVLFHRDPAGFRVDSNVVYATVTGDGVLEIRKHLLRVPDDVIVETPEVPYLTLVGAGDSFSEDVRLALPITARDPYRAREQTEPYDVQRLTLSLGYVLDDEPLEVKEVPMSDGTVRLRASYTSLVHRQRLKVVGPVAIGHAKSA
jgi:hypothetical protein